MGSLFTTLKCVSNYKEKISVKYYLLWYVTCYKYYIKWFYFIENKICLLKCKILSLSVSSLLLNKFNLITL